MTDRRTWPWCRRCATLLLFLAACDGGAKAPAKRRAPRVDAAPVASSTQIPVEDSRHLYYRGYLADVVAGDRERAARYYQEVLGHGAEQPALVARAALRLAGWAESDRQRRLAMDLAVRASVLGADIPQLKSEADELRRRIALTVRAQDIEVRGPKAGTVLLGVQASVAEQFARAEKLLAAYHRRRLKPRLEALSASVKGKRAAMQRAVRAYREVVEAGGDEAAVAAEFRIASLHYDYSLSLSFELPSELAPEVASRIRSSLRAEVREVRAEARSAYKRSLLAATSAGPEIRQWSDAASLGLSSVEDLLRSGK